MRKRKPEKCPCDLDAFYKVCCGQFHSAKMLAETPVQLMRSRLSAYSKGKADYIIATTDPSGPRWEPDQAAWRASILEFSSTYQFRLEVLSTAVDGDEGIVVFNAILIRNTPTIDRSDPSFSERSSFKKVDGVWLYFDGVVEPIS